MRVHITVFCSECPAEEPQIITLFTRERYCGRHCLAEGQLKYVRMIIRARAEEVEHGQM